MKEISIFIDESGDFGEYQTHSPYYIVSLVFHEQKTIYQKMLKSLMKNFHIIIYITIVYIQDLLLEKKKLIKI